MPNRVGIGTMLFVCLFVVVYILDDDDDDKHHWTIISEIQMLNQSVCARFKAALSDQMHL